MIELSAATALEGGCSRARRRRARRDSLRRDLRRARPRREWRDRPRNRDRCRRAAPIGKESEKPTNRSGLPPDKRAELYAGRPHGRERLGQYPVGPEEGPPFVVSCHHPECRKGFWKSSLAA